MPVIGFFHLTSLETNRDNLATFRQGLADTGYIEGKNVAIQYRWAQGRNDMLPTLVAELVRLQVSVIVVLESTNGALAAKAATTTIPIVFAIGADPVDLGLVSSLNRPGGNVTGVAFLVNTLGAKRLELLREPVPSATVIGFLINPGNPSSESQIRDVQAAARAFGVELLVLNASSERNIDAAFAGFVQQRAKAVIIGADSFFVSRRDQLVGLAARHAMPATYFLREFADIGGLMSYGPSQTDAYRVAGSLTARILKGEKPTDLPVVQSSKFELVINLKTAKVLGVKISDNLLSIADEVIE
jgi:ABC-type uncharacterized transport system substrate-binding protein